MLAQRINTRNRKEIFPSRRKLAILKRHQVDNVPVTDLCDEYVLQLIVFYRWQKEFFEHGTVAFDRDRVRQKNKETERMRKLEQKLQRKSEVLSEPMEEHFKVNGTVRQIFKERDEKLEAATQLRKEKRHAAVRADRNSGGYPPHQAPITYDCLVCGAHSRNRSLPGLSSVEK